MTPWNQGDQWWDIEQDGLPPHLATVWIHNNQPTVHLAVLTDDEEWVGAFDVSTHYTSVMAWRRFVPPKPPVRNVDWAEPVDRD